MDAKATAKRLKDLIADNQHEQAIDEMLELLQSSGGEGEEVLYALRGRKNKLDTEVAKGIISKENEDLESNKIRDTLLTYADRIGKGEINTFSLSSPLSRHIDHDTKVFYRFESLTNFKSIKGIHHEINKTESIQETSILSIKDLMDFFADPANEFLLKDIAEKAEEFSDSLGELSENIKNNIEAKEEMEKEPRAAIKTPLFELQIPPELNGIRFYLTLEGMKESAEKVLNSYNAFRKEVKQKLII